MTAPAVGSGANQPPGAGELTLVPAPGLPGITADPRRHVVLGRALHTMATVTGLRLLRSFLSVTITALKRAWGHRVLGLSAEAGFWQLLSLPSLAFGLIGLLGYLDSAIGADTIQRLRENILDASRTSLTPDTVDSVVKPVLDGILSGHKVSLISIGFFISLWSGSSAMATFVNTITIAYDQRDLRGAVASRFLALGLYIASILGIVVMLPILVIGPGVMRSWKIVSDHHWLSTTIGLAYWPVVASMSLLALASLYHLAVPVRPRWRDTLPGSIAAATIWIVGAVGLRSYVQWVFHRTLDYGALAAPVAILLFCYITALAILLGAEINAEMDRRRAARSAHDHGQAPTLAL